MLEIHGEMASRWSAFAPGPVQEITLHSDQVALRMLRLDLIRSWASGNKYFKLKYVLQDALASGRQTLVSKGGMFSNHLAALSEACSVFDLHLVAVIRSHAPDEFNPSIQRLRAHKHEILYLTSQAYTSFDANAAELLFPGALFIPEGGLSDTGIRGTSEILRDSITYDPSHIIVAGGSMGTACGMIAAAQPSSKVIIVPAWKGCTRSYVCEILDRYGIHPSCSWELWPDYHFGGFGRFNLQLIDFMTWFTQETHIPLDPVYTGKLMFAINDKMKSGYFSDTDSILSVHTGGMQGLAGYKYRFPEEWGSYLP